MVFFLKFIVFRWITWVFSPNPFYRGNRFWNKLMSKIMSWSVRRSEGWFCGRFRKANFALSFFTFFLKTCMMIFCNRNALGNSDIIYQFGLFHWCGIFMAQTTFYCAIKIEILFNKERLKRNAEHNIELKMMKWVILGDWNI